MLYIVVNFTQNLEPNRWPKSDPLALNVVHVVAQRWPVGKQRAYLLGLTVPEKSVTKTFHLKGYGMTESQNDRMTKDKANPV